MTEFLFILFALIVGHALADYPLQGDFLAKAKNRNSPIVYVPWQWAMAMHALIHGGMVALITGSLLLGLLEAALHSAIDFAKCERLIDFSQDQWLHLACKLAWALLAVAWL